MEECTFVLGTNENLAEIIDHCLKSPDGHCALDLETTGLDNRVFNGATVDKIVGVCLSPDGFTGYYIPLGHASNNVSWTIFTKEFKRLLDSEIIFDFHGGNFDKEFLQFNGGESLGGEVWDSQKRWEDTEILAYLDDTRRKDKRLKTLSKELCGIEQIHIHELWGHPSQKRDFNYDFSQLDPTKEEVLLYGGGDGIATYRLRQVLAPRVYDKDQFGNSQATVYAIEKACVPATRWMKRNRIHIDIEKVKELIFLGQREWHESISEVYSEAERILGRPVKPGYYRFLDENFISDDQNNLLEGQLRRAKEQYQTQFPDPLGVVEAANGKSYPMVYDINSPAQLGQMFEEMAVPGLTYTEKSGQVKTAQAELERVIESAHAKFPFMGKIKRFREIAKALSNYLLPLLNESDQGTIAINFRAHKVDTGRFSTQGSKSLHGWPNMNFQSIPATYDPNRPECMTRIRECIVAPKGFYIVAVDYSGVELRIVTNLSRETKWLNEYFRCSNCDHQFEKGAPGKTPDRPAARCPSCGSDKIGDLHTLTAFSVYGGNAIHRPDWKQLRQNAKGVNFALCYGGGGNAVVRSCGVDKNEGWRIKNVFDESYPVLHRWWGSMHAFARKHEYVLTAFGRKYPLPDINHTDGGFRSKAERNAVNGPVQGTSADITKLAMAMIYKEVKERGWFDKVRMVITMHDELVFEIHESIVIEATDIIRNIMTRNAAILRLRWPIPLTTDAEIGPNWTVPWDLESMRAGEQPIPSELAPYMNPTPNDKEPSGGLTGGSGAKAYHLLGGLSELVVKHFARIFKESGQGEGEPFDIVLKDGTLLTQSQPWREYVEPYLPKDLKAAAVVQALGKAKL